ncbi:MAG: glycosyltransferase family 39 protein [Acidobacteria bacterium]|nr:glycosyltransferase family 39 protein [Acidobacteriota bacterium]
MMTRKKTPQKARKAPERQGTPWSRLTPRRTTVTALLVFLLMGIWLRLAYVNVSTPPSPDETLYVRTAKQMSEKGFSARTGIPLKRTYLALLAGVMKISGAYDARAGAWLSTAASILSLMALGAIGARFLSPWAAVYAMFSLAASLLARVAARRCWQESIMEFLGLLMVWSACEITRNHRKWWPYVTLFGFAGCAVLVKPLGIFVALAAVSYVLALLMARREWRMLAGFALGGLLAAGLSLWALSELGRGTGRLSALYTIFYASRVDDQYSWATRHQSGPWYSMVQGLWILTPVNLVFCAVATALAVTRDRILERLGLRFGTEERALLRLFASTSVFVLAVISVLPLAQNFRFLASIYGAMYLLAGMGFAAILDLANRHLRWFSAPAVAILALVVVSGAVAEQGTFERVFVRGGMQDLALDFVIRLSYYDN